MLSEMFKFSWLQVFLCFLLLLNPLLCIGKESVERNQGIAKEYYERCKRLKKLSRSRFTKIEFCKHHIDRVSYKARYYVFENQDDKTDVNFLRYSAFRKGIGLGKSVLIQKDHLEDAEVTINQVTNDVYYSFGDTFNITFGYGTIVSGNSELLTLSDNKKYTSNSVTGNLIAVALGLKIMNVELLISKNIINAIYTKYSRTLMGVPEYTDRVIQLKQDLNTIGIGFIYDF